MENLIVVKIGGNIIDDDRKLDSFLLTYAQIEGNKILVHGGGKVATEIGQKLGIESKYIHGRRITDAETLDLVTMVYGGLLNKKIVAALQKNSCNAMGLSGADGNIIRADKRAVKEIDYGFVGDVNATGVNSKLLTALLASGVVPVLAPLTHDGMGTMLNTNADTIAQEIAKAMAGIMNVRLIYCFEKKGLLLNAEDNSTVVPSVNRAEYAELIEQEVIYGGMIPKLDNAFEAIGQGVSEVVIGHADDLPKLITGTAGTKIID